MSLATTTAQDSSAAAGDASAPVLRPLGQDVVDSLLGIEPGSHLDTLRAARATAREDTQRAYDELFDPRDDSHLSRAERAAVAAFVVGLHTQVSDGPGPHTAGRHAAGRAENAAHRGVGALRMHYDDLLEATAPDLLDAVRGVVEAGTAPGPFGSYREPDLAAESTDGLRLRLDAAQADALGVRLTAAFEHAHLLVLRPREARREHLDALLAAGWDTTGIVTLSQLVSYLAYQVRLVAGLAALAAAPAHRTAATHPQEDAR